MTVTKNVGKQFTHQTAC